MGNKIGPAVRKSCICCRSAPKTIEKKYSVLETDLLGEGTFAKVFKGTNRKTKQEVAVKVVDKAKQRSDLLDTEIWILQTFGNHPNIVHFYDIYETETEVKLVIEFMAGGELFDLLDENGPYGEADAAKHLRAVASGLAYLHAGNVVHRDLKPENLLLTSKGPEGILKIADFGLSKILIDEELIKVACGTWIYSAPEVLSLKQGHLGQYGTQSDVFSLGCIIFLIMGGYHPFDFDGNDDEELMQECILSETWDFDDPAWEEVSHQAKDLIEQMLKYKPQDRISAAELAAHPWATGHVSYGRLSQSIDKNLKKTRASLRNNKLEGAEMVRKSLDATAAEICKVVVQDADSTQQARAAPDLPELQDLAPTIAPQAGGGALRVPCRRMSQNSNNSKNSNKSTRSCPGRRKAAAVQEDAVKEDILPKGDSGHAGENDVNAADTSKLGVSHEAGHVPTQCLADCAGIGVEDTAEPEKITVEELKIGSTGTDPTLPTVAEEEDGTRGTKSSYGSKRKKVEAPKEIKTFRPTQDQQQADSFELRGSKSVDWSKRKSTKSVTEEWKAKRASKLALNNANGPVKAPIGRLTLPEAPEAFEVTTTGNELQAEDLKAIDQAASMPVENQSIQRRNSKKKVISIDQKSTASRTSRGASPKKKGKVGGDAQDALLRLQRASIQ